MEEIADKKLSSSRCLLPCRPWAEWPKLGHVNMPKKWSELLWHERELFTKNSSCFFACSLFTLLFCCCCCCCIHFFTSGLAMLIELYVKAINTPGAVPNMESAWDVFVKTKCSKAQTTAKDNYKVTMSSHLEGALPCDGDFILRSHSAALSLCKSCFMEETKGISTTTVQEYLIPLQVNQLYPVLD